MNPAHDRSVIIDKPAEVSRKVDQAASSASRSAMKLGWLPLQGTSRVHTQKQAQLFLSEKPAGREHHHVCPQVACLGIEVERSEATIRHVQSPCREST